MLITVTSIPALNAIHHQMDEFSIACGRFGPNAGTKKIEAMYQPASGKPDTDPCITANQRLQAVQSFAYLLTHPPWTWNLITVSPKHALHLVDSGQMCGRLRGVGYGYPQSLKGLKGCLDHPSSCL